MSEKDWLVILIQCLVAAFAWGGFFATTRFRIKTLEEAFKTLALADRRMLGRLNEHALRLLRAEIMLGITTNTHRRVEDSEVEHSEDESGG